MLTACAKAIPIQEWGNKGNVSAALWYTLYSPRVSLSSFPSKPSSLVTSNLSSILSGQELLKLPLLIQVQWNTKALNERQDFKEKGQKEEIEKIKIEQNDETIETKNVLKGKTMQNINGSLAIIMLQGSLFARCSIEDAQLICEPQSNIPHAKTIVEDCAKFINALIPILQNQTNLISSKNIGVASLENTNITQTSDGIFEYRIKNRYLILHVTKTTFK